MRRFIDDIFGIWVPSGSPNTWEDFERDLPFGILQWYLKELMTTVNFLNLTISINADHHIDTRTYQKATNLYLYLPPQSMHPPNVIRGMIYGLLRKYHEQNTDQEHYIEMTVLLHRHLRAQGWEAALLKSLFEDTTAKVELQRP